MADEENKGRPETARRGTDHRERDPMENDGVPAQPVSAGGMDRRGE